MSEFIANVRDLLDRGPHAWMMSAAHTLIGTSGDDMLKGGKDDDSISGLAGDDALKGGAGADTLNGGEGADTLNGGVGDDTYGVDQAGDVVVEGPDGGVDTVFAGASYTLGANLEDLVMESRYTTGIGNELDNLLAANTDTVALYGLAGADTLVATDNADTLIGGRGDDLYLVDGYNTVVTEAAPGGRDTVQVSTGLFRMGDYIETLIFTGSRAGYGFGNAQDNRIIGGDFNDVLDGGLGSDTINGGKGEDTAAYGSAASGVTVSLLLSGRQDTSGGGVDLLRDIEDLNGSRFDDALTGDQYANRLEGGGGADTLTGGLGADTFAFTAPKHSTAGAADRITDLSNQDVIDLGRIDANTQQSYDQAFQLVAQFDHHGGELVVSYDSAADRTMVSGYVDSDDAVDLVIEIDGDHRDFTNFVL